MLSGARNHTEASMNFGPNAPIEEIDMIARYGTAGVIAVIAVFGLVWLAINWTDA